MITMITVLAGRYHALVYTAQKAKIGLSQCLSHTHRALVIYHAVQNIAVTWQSNANGVCANGVLVRLICDGSGPRFIRSCFVVL